MYWAVFRAVALTSFTKICGSGMSTASLTLDRALVDRRKTDSRQYARQLLRLPVAQDPMLVRAPSYRPSLDVKGADSLVAQV